MEGFSIFDGYTWIEIASILDVVLMLLIGVGLLIVLGVAIVDVVQTRSAIRRNFPFLAHFRYLFEHLGTFFRQYFFAMDREELPFNRADRQWIYRACKNLDTTVPFGSTRDLHPNGTIIFSNSAFPPLTQDVAEPHHIVIGPYTAHPYHHDKLFNISGMSYGAISKPAILALANGAKAAGIWLNTGEGGLSPYHLSSGCDVVFQIGTAKFGVRDKDGLLSEERLAAIAAHESVKMFEVKLSQGAKPGKGGILPAEKITPEIAQIRGIPMGKDAISPNRHIEISCVTELLDFIERVRTVTEKPVGIKAVIGDYDWLERLCTEVLARGIESAPDFICIDSADGGTGAAPMSLIDYVGLTIKESLPTTVDILKRYGLKERIIVISSGKLVTPGDVAWALCAGADYVVSARGFMFALGCIQSLQCNKNTCPTGVATHKKRLQRGLNPTYKANRVASYAMNMEKEVGIIAHSCGVKDPRDLRREHVRIMSDENRSVSMITLYPYEPKDTKD